MFYVFFGDIYFILLDFMVYHNHQNPKFFYGKIPVRLTSPNKTHRINFDAHEL